MSKAKDLSWLLMQRAYLRGAARRCWLSMEPTDEGGPDDKFGKFQSKFDGLYFMLEQLEKECSTLINELENNGTA